MQHCVMCPLDFQGGAITGFPSRGAVPCRSYGIESGRTAPRSSGGSERRTGRLRRQESSAPFLYTCPGENPVNSGENRSDMFQPVW